MPDTFDENGLQVKTLTELSDELKTSLRGVYGEDINLDSNSPDGQVVGIVSQEGVDLREQLLNVNAGFDPDQAEGITLDQRVGLIGIKRGAGTFTLVPVSITTTKALTLVGLDDQAGVVNPSVPNLYTVKDDAGNQWWLLATQSPSAAGTYSYSFQAATIGAVEVTPNTITTPVTVVDGVSTVNNPLGATQAGVDEESDQDLRIRFHTSQSLAASGFLDTLVAALRQVSGVVSAIVSENYTGVTDADGTPAHSIWAIVEGGASAAIAQTIYAKRSGGCGMRGAVTYDIPIANGDTFTAKWDVPVEVPIYLQFALDLPGGAIDPLSIKTAIVANISWLVGADAVGSTITAFILSLNPAYRVSGMGLSDDDLTFVETLLSTSPENRFVMDISRIEIT